MLTAGLDKTLRLFNVDGVQCSKIQGVHFGDLPVFCAEWSAHGNEIYCCGRRPYFYCYDVGKGSVTKVCSCASRSLVFPYALLARFTASSGVTTKQYIQSPFPLQAMPLRCQVTCPPPPPPSCTHAAHSR